MLLGVFAAHVNRNLLAMHAHRCASIAQAYCVCQRSTQVFKPPVVIHPRRHFNISGASSPWIIAMGAWHTWDLQLGSCSKQRFLPF
jgi:hypothetical protein